MDARGWKEGKVGVMWVKEQKAAVIRRISSECAIYTTVTIVNTWH